MIFFNGEITMLGKTEKIASPLFTLVLLFSITGYVLLINLLLPATGMFVK